MQRFKLSVGSKKKYWYKFFYEECVLCGRSSKWKERQYTPRPKEWWERHDERQYACGDHF